MADDGDGFGSQYTESGSGMGGGPAPMAPPPDAPPESGGFGSTFSAAGSTLKSMFGGPQYKAADPDTSPLDAASGLLQQRVKRANQIATNPIAQIFAPEQVQAARDFVPKAVEQLQTIEQQRQHAADVRTTARNWGLTKPDQFGAQATDTTLANEALRQWKDEGNFNAYKALSGLSPEWKNRADLYMPDAMTKFGQHVQGVQKGIVALDAAVDMNSEAAYKATRERLIRENDLGAIGVKPDAIPETRDGWVKVRGSLQTQYNQAARTLKSFNARQDQLNQAVPVTDEKVAKQIEGSYQLSNGETIPGFKTVGLPGYGDVQGVQGPPGSKDTANFGKTWSTAAPEQIKTVQEQLKAEEVKGALSKYKMARDFLNTAHEDALYKRAAGIALNADELGAIGRNVAEGTKAAGSIGLTKMLESKYGTIDSARNALERERSALLEWLGKPPRARLSPPSIAGIKEVAEFKHREALKELSDRIAQPLETAGRYGMPLKNLGLDKEVTNDPALMGAYSSELRNTKQTIDSYPMVVIGDRRVMLPKGSNVPGAVVAPLDHSDDSSQAPGVRPLPAPAQSGTNPVVGPPNSQPPQAGGPGPVSPQATGPGPNQPPPGSPNAPGAASRFPPSGPPQPGSPPGTPNAPVAPPTGGSAPGRTGLPPGMQLNSPAALDAAANRTIQIESGFKPGSKTGSYVGLGQWSREEMKRHGITDPDDVEQTRAALKVDMAARAAKLQKDGLPPTPANVYLMHQQGEAGLEAHLRNPGGAAWENIRFGFRTDAIAKRAIWGNMTPEMRKQFPGGVENVTSGDFTRLWEARYNGTDRTTSGAGAAARMLAGGSAEDALNPEQRTAPRHTVGTRRDVREGTTDFTPGERGQTDWGRAAIEHAPAIGSTAGAVAGGLAGGPGGAVVGGGAGGAAGQSLKDYLLGNPQSPGQIAKQGALGAVLGVAPVGRPVVGAALRAGGAGAVEAGAKFAEGGDAVDAAEAGVEGAGAAAVGEGFGRALGMAGHKVYSLFTGSAQKAVRTAAAELHAANEVLKTEQPKLPGAAGAAATANPKYDAAIAAKEKAELTLKEMMPNAKPEDVAYAHKVSSEGVPRQEAAAARPGAVERENIGAGYRQLETEVGNKGVGAPKASPKLADGPIAAVENKAVSAKHAELAQRTEAAITAPAKDWQSKWTQLKDVRSALLDAERDAMTSTAPGRTQTAKDMRTLADTVRAQQVKAANAVFGPVKGPEVIKRLEMLDTRYARLMKATSGGDLDAAARMKGEAGRDADRAFRAFAQDDHVAIAAWTAMRGKGPDVERDIRTLVGAEKIPVLGHLISAAKLLGGYNQWRAERAAGSAARFEDFVPELKGSSRTVRNVLGSAGARAGVSLSENGL